MIARIWKKKQALVFIQKTLKESAKQKALDIFHNIGRCRELGSVPATVSAGKSVTWKKM
jgi:hypothetical protein